MTLLIIEHFCGIKSTFNSFGWILYHMQSYYLKFKSLLFESDAVLPMAHDHFDISLKGAVLPGSTDTEMVPVKRQLISHFGVLNKYTKSLIFVMPKLQ